MYVLYLTYRRTLFRQRHRKDKDVYSRILFGDKSEWGVCYACVGVFLVVRDRSEMERVEWGYIEGSGLEGDSLMNWEKEGC